MASPSSLQTSLVPLDQSSKFDQSSSINFNSLLKEGNRPAKSRVICLKGVPNLKIPFELKLKLDKRDKIADETYRKLIQDKEDQGKPYLLALVINRDPKSLFPYELCDANKLRIKLRNEEGTQKNIQGICYFILQPKAQEFKYLTSETSQNQTLKLRDDVGFFIAENNQDTPMGQYVLAHHYKEGCGTEKDHVKAFNLFKLSADKGYDKAELATAECYAKGMGVARDFIKATTYYEVLSLKGNPIARYALGVIYLKGKNGQANLTGAVEQFKFASKGEKGCHKSLYRLGIQYLKGEGVPLKPQKGISFLHEAAKRGNYAKSYFGLGQIYEEGKFTEIDIDKATQNYRMAQKFGHPEAEKAFSSIQAANSFPKFNIFKS